MKLYNYRKSLEVSLLENAAENLNRMGNCIYHSLFFESIL